MIDLPPDWLIRAAKYALNKTDRWTDAMSILCAYYNVPILDYLRDPQQVPKGAVACYIPHPSGLIGHCYSKGDGLDPSTVFHELAHHLNHFLFKTCTLKNQANEAFAEIFADEMTRKWERLT